MQSNIKNLKIASFEQENFLSNAQIYHIQSAVLLAISRKEHKKPAYLQILNKILALNKGKQVEPLQGGELKTLKEQILKPHIASIGQPDYDFASEFCSLILELQNRPTLEIGTSTRYALSA